MIYWDLFINFLKVGTFSFGGGYGAISIIRDIVLSNGWLDDEMLAYIIAVGESTPGPIMVNLATFVGNSQAGFLCGLLATTAVVLPSFIIILLVTAILKTILKNPYFQAVLGGLKPCVIGIVLATGVYMILRNCFRWESGFRVDTAALIVTLILGLVLMAYKRIVKKNMSPILLILISAVVGMVAYSL